MSATRRSAGLSESSVTRIRLSMPSSTLGGALTPFAGCRAELPVTRARRGLMHTLYWIERGFAASFASVKLAPDGSWAQVLARQPPALTRTELSSIVGGHMEGERSKREQAC